MFRPTLRHAIASVVACVLLGPSPDAAGKETTQSEPPDIVFVEAPAVVTGELSGRFPRGSKLIRRSSSRITELKNLTPQFFAASDPEVSFDRVRILFSAQWLSSDKWQVWEMEADGSKTRKLTECQEGCVRPAYLPAGQIAYTVLTRGGSPRTPRR